MNLKSFEIMEKLYTGTSKNFSKMAGKKMHTLHPTLWIRPWPLATKPSKESGILQSLGTIILFFFTKRQSQKRGTWHNAPPLNTLLTALHLFRDMIIIEKESTIAFNAIEKLVTLFQNLEKAEKKRFYVSTICKLSEK